MSYDLTFLNKTAGQSWEEALEAAEEDDGFDGQPDRRAWAAILEGARSILGEIGEHRDERHFELDHRATGIQVALYDGEASITVPYWHKGAAARRVVRAIYDLGQVVEKNTALLGYDPQLELPIAEAAAQPHLAEAVFEQV